MGYSLFPKQRMVSIHGLLAELICTPANYSFDEHDGPPKSVNKVRTALGVHVQYGVSDAATCRQ